MNLVGLAWRNVGRNKRRSLLSALAVGFAVAALMFSMGLQKGSYTEMIYHAVHAHAGHIQIQRAGYLDDRDLAYKLDGAGRLMDLLEREAPVRAFAPRINAAALVSKGDRTTGASLFGIDPRREAATSTLADVIVAGEYLQPGDSEGALLGERLARHLGAAVGDEIVFLGQGADGSLAAGKLIVRGLYRFGTEEMDRLTMAMPLPTAQRAYAMEDAVSAIAVLLDRDEQRPDAARRIEGLLSAHDVGQAVVVGWPELLPGVEQSIRMDWSSGLILYAVLALIVGFGIANTFLMAFMERIHECGVMLSVGMRPLRLSALMYVESVLLTLLGVGLGLAIGIPLVAYFQVHGIDFGAEMGEFMKEYGLSSIIHLQLTREVVGYAVGIVSAVTLLVALYPALKASRLKPVEALGHL